MDSSPGFVPETREPIRLPGSPFWNVFRSFGRDEALALGINLVVTVVAGYFTTSAVLLALAGPVVEKIGFYPGHMWEAYRQYRAEQPTERTLRSYVWQAIGGGTGSLAWDVLVHDPLYVALFLALSLYPGVPAWLLSLVAFVAAVAGVAWAQVAWDEGRYALLKRRLRKAGFEIDSYLEARFYIRGHGHTAEVACAKLTELLGLHQVERLRYFDRYFTNALPRFSGRAPVVRLRKRTFGKSSARWRNKDKMVAIGFAQTLQVVYTRPQEEPIGFLDQFRFFSVSKDKLFFPIDEERMPESIVEVQDPGIRRLLRAGREFKSVSFERTILLDATNALYVAVDALPQEEGCVIELKVRERDDHALFLRAMRTVMLELPVTHTTNQKVELGLF